MNYIQLDFLTFLKEDIMDISNIRWKAILGMAVVWMAMYFGWNWIWGIIFLMILVPELRMGSAHFIEEVEKSRNPIVFWFIMVSWLLMSLYQILTGLDPRLNPESIHFIGYQNGSVISQSVGTYQDKEPIKVRESKAVTPVKLKDSIKYLEHRSKKMHFVGVKTLTTTESGQSEKDIASLWDYYMKNDLSSFIPNKIDDRVYVIFSEYGKPAASYFTVTLGYRTKDTSSAKEGLNGVIVPPTRFAVVNNKKKTEKGVIETWANINESNLPRALTSDIEVYTLNPSTYKISKSEIWISLKNANKPSKK